MKNSVLEVFDKHAPRIMKKVRGKLAPWLTDDVKKLMNERDKLLGNRQIRSFIKRSIKRREKRLILL